MLKYTKKPPNCQNGFALSIN